MFGDSGDGESTNPQITIFLESRGRIWIGFDSFVDSSCQPVSYSSFGGTVDEPQAAKPVQHGKNMEVAKGVPKKHVRLEVELS